jgi:3-hydroxyisobutyrate dehydrogenase-like beta-hydroxyacid dehydrogenase
MRTIGMIGLGNAGGAVASALVRHFEVVGFDADAARRAPAEASGVRWAGDAAEVAGSAECVLLSLPHPDISRQVVDTICAAARRLALATAQDLGVPLFAILAAHTPYEIAEQLGMGDQDYAALARLWEQWCQVRFDAAADKS